jgi:hydroxyacylglutathione hydrolase
MLEIVPLPALRDNYIWTLRAGRHAAVVDPGEARPVLEYLARGRLELVAILATHHHPDHVGGIPELLAKGRVPVFGPKGEPIATLTRPVGEGDTVEIPALGLALSVLDIPGHTRAHIAYYGAESLFCGDTLFACGCGRLFEGTPEQMMSSLAKLAALPDSTRVYCGHEYTLANIAFAQQVEPKNAALAARLARDRKLRDAGNARARACGARVGERSARDGRRRARVGARARAGAVRHARGFGRRAADGQSGQSGQSVRARGDRRSGASARSDDAGCARARRAAGACR